MTDDWKSLSGEQRRRFTDQLLSVYGWNCSLCKLPITKRSDATCEHIVPRSAGGTTTLENCRPAHPACNYSRGAGGYTVEVIEHDGISLFWP